PRGERRSAHGVPPGDAPALLDGDDPRAGGGLAQARRSPDPGAGPPRGPVRGPVVGAGGAAPPACPARPPLLHRLRAAPQRARGLVVATGTTACAVTVVTTEGEE